MSQPGPIASHHTLYAQGQPLYIGDRIKLFATSPYPYTPPPAHQPQQHSPLQHAQNSSQPPAHPPTTPQNQQTPQHSTHNHTIPPSSTHPGGYLGLYKSPQTQTAPYVLSIPPHDPPLDEKYFRPEIYTILSSNDELNFRAQCGKREPVLFGMTLVLISDEGYVWNNKVRGLKGYVCPKQRGLKGEMWVSFNAPGKTLSNVCLGDVVSIDIDDSHRSRTKYSQRLTVFRPEPSKIDRIKARLHRYDHDENSTDTSTNKSNVSDLQVHVPANSHASNLSVDVSTPHGGLQTTTSLVSSSTQPNPADSTTSTSGSVPGSTPSTPINNLNVKGLLDHKSSKPGPTDNTELRTQVILEETTPTGTSQLPTRQSQYTFQNNPSTQITVPQTPLPPATAPSQLTSTNAQMNVNSVSILCNGKGIPTLFTIHHFQQHIFPCNYPYESCQDWVCGTDSTEEPVSNALARSNSFLDPYNTQPHLLHHANHNRSHNSHNDSNNVTTDLDPNYQYNPNTHHSANDHDNDLHYHHDHHNHNLNLNLRRPDSADLMTSNGLYTSGGFNLQLSEQEPNLPVRLFDQIPRLSNDLPQNDSRRGRLFQGLRATRDRWFRKPQNSDTLLPSDGTFQQNHAYAQNGGPSTPGPNIRSNSLPRNIDTNKRYNNCVVQCNHCNGLNAFPVPAFAQYGQGQPGDTRDKRDNDRNDGKQDKQLYTTPVKGDKFADSTNNIGTFDAASFTRSNSHSDLSDTKNVTDISTTDLDEGPTRPISSAISSTGSSSHPSTIPLSQTQDKHQGSQTSSTQPQGPQNSPQQQPSTLPSSVKFTTSVPGPDGRALTVKEQKEQLKADKEHLRQLEKQLEKDFKTREKVEKETQRREKRELKEQQRSGDKSLSHTTQPVQSAAKGGQTQYSSTPSHAHTPVNTTFDTPLITPTAHHSAPQTLTLPALSTVSEPYNDQHHYSTHNSTQYTPSHHHPQSTHLQQLHHPSHYNPETTHSTQPHTQTSRLPTTSTTSLNQSAVAVIMGTGVYQNDLPLLPFMQIAEQYHYHSTNSTSMSNSTNAHSTHTASSFLSTSPPPVGSKSTQTGNGNGNEQEKGMNVNDNYFPIPPSPPKPLTSSTQLPSSRPQPQPTVHGTPVKNSHALTNTASDNTSTQHTRRFSASTNFPSSPLELATHTTTTIFCPECSKYRKIYRIIGLSLITYTIAMLLVQLQPIQLFTIPSLIGILVIYALHDRQCGHISHEQHQLSHQPVLTIPLAADPTQFSQLLPQDDSTLQDSTEISQTLSIPLTNLQMVSLSSFADGVRATGTLTPQQAFEYVTSSLFHPAFPSYGVEEYEDDVPPNSTQLINSKYRLPNKDTMTQLNVIQATVTPLPPLLEAKKNPDFQRILAAVCMDMPQRFIEAEAGDVVKAKERWYTTKKWREDTNIDRLLTTSYTLFPAVRKLCGHFYHGADKEGNFIYVDRPGCMQFSKLRQHNIDDDALQRHFMHGCEYQWNIISASTHGKCFSILDLQGLGFMDMFGASMSFFKRISALLQSHYPVRSSRIVIVNVPSWFSKLWGVVSPLLHERTRQKVIICGSDKTEMAKMLLKYVDADQLPSNYGGTCKCPGGCDVGHEIERNYREFVQLVNQHNAKTGRL